ncbi:META domain-containing protein [Defluviimonas sp. WL0024]|uniref:META domain-containing protein n=2 Tax=Albidovulum TaxID=205889 RepID=A0ABT3IYP1_9RHOB|nr:MULTISPECIES: META domain-containing protein [Defluviimonas]MCU9848477.1 META domain-containing protein [Defluviimonas sp. WL0024]MCW3780539.1 META domain-containing protein [Defluviimonas salinarum]
MRLPLASAAALAVLAACQGDETISGYAGTDTAWRLVEIDGAPFTARAVIRFPEAGQVAGEAPCNTFSGRQSAPYPWFKAEALAVTRRACDALAEETRFFAAFGRVSLAEVQGDMLILSDPDGPEMVFEKVQP